MSNFFYHTVLYFFLYAFLGWCLEVVYAAVQKRKFVNRGLLNGILCPIYGISMVFMLIFFEPLKNRIFFLLWACFLLDSILEALAGALLERLIGRKCWDYSGYRDHLGSYVCLRFSLIWAVLAVLAIKIFHPLLAAGVGMLPALPVRIVVVVLCVMFAVDVIATAAALRSIKLKNKRMQRVARGMRRLAKNLDRVIAGAIERRMERSFPLQAEIEEERAEKQREREQKKAVFA